MGLSLLLFVFSMLMYQMFKLEPDNYNYFYAQVIGLVIGVYIMIGELNEQRRK